MSNVLDFDELKLYFGDDIVINDYVKVHVPTVGEIVEYGEREYYSTLHLLTAIPSDMKSGLFDAGIDYEEIKDFELFYLLTRSLTPERTGIFLYDLDLSSLKLSISEENNKMVLANDEGNTIIDELAYIKLVGCLRKIHGIVPKIEHAANKTTKRILIQLDRDEIERQKREPYKSNLKFLISAMMRYPGFKYKTKELKECSIYEFMDTARGAQVYVQSTALLQGSYSGMIDTKKINKQQFNWMRDITEEK